MIGSIPVRSGIAVVAGIVLTWGVAGYGIDVLQSPAMGVAALIFTVFGTDWLR